MTQRNPALPFNPPQAQKPATASSKAWEEQAREQLGAYGYGLAEDHRITKGGRVLGVTVGSVRGGRFQTRLAACGSLLWSGPDLGRFLAQFWFAEKAGG